jgi:hypothetical protein
MYQIEEENPLIIRYINNNNNIYRIHPTIYIGFDSHQLFRQYRDTIWVDASESIEYYSNKKDFHNEDSEKKTFIIKSDENYKHKSFFLIKKSDIIEDNYKLWDCMIYVIKNTENVNLPPIISSSNILLGY